jgi:hypothetical protein
LKFIQQIDTATGAQNFGTPTLTYTGETTDANLTEIFVDGTPDNRAVVAENSYCLYSGNALAVKDDGSVVFSATLRFKTDRTSGNTTVTKLQEVYDDYEQYDSFAATIDKAYTDANNELKLIVTTPTGTFTWRIDLTITQILL